MPGSNSLRGYSNVPVPASISVVSHSTNLEVSWSASLSIVDGMLRHPDHYPPGAGREYREHL